MDEEKRHYRPELQGLRGIAILLVVLAHAGAPGFSGGFVGVDMFFVLSGYLITGILLREYRATAHIRLLPFLARRLKRLLPALLVMLTLTLLLAAALLSSYEFSEQTASVGYAASWSSNLYFAFTEVDYFAELRHRDLYLHTWSLGIEEQFYLAWPLLLLATAALARRRGWPAPPFLALLGFLAAGSLLLSFYWSYHAHELAFYLMPSRIWEFSLGALVAVLEQRRLMPTASSAGRSRASANAAFATGIIAVLFSSVLLQADSVYPGAWALIPACGTALLIAACGKPTALPARALSHPWLTWLGDRSYSLYLWHWPLLMLGFALGLQGNPSATTALVLLSVLFSMASYRYVELPFWKGRYRHPSPGITLGASTAAIAAVTLAALQFGSVFADDAATSMQLARKIRNDLPAIYRMKDCDNWYHDADLVPCTLGNESAPRKVALIGDSIGAQWFSMLPAVFAADQWHITVLTKSSCAIIDEDYEHHGGTYHVCREWRNKAIDYLTELQPDILFIGNAATYDFTPRQWTDGTRRILARLAPHVGRMYVIPGTPKLNFDGPGCIARRLSQTDTTADHRDLPACRMAVSEQPAIAVSRHLRRATASLPNAALLDLNGLVCPEQQCSAFSTDGIAVFRDQQHLTDTFVRSRSTQIRRLLNNL